MQKMTEQELASRCAQGDDAARKELYLTYGTRMRALCRRYTANAAEADDLMQDTFIKIFRVIDRFVWTRPGSLYSWMSRVAINMAFDSAKLKKRLAREIMDVEDLVDAASEEPDRDGTETIPFEALKDMIEALPEGYRTIFKLYCIDNLSHKEIASLLGIKEKSSSASLARARASLAGAIKKYLEDNTQ